MLKLLNKTPHEHVAELLDNTVTEVTKNIIYTNKITKTLTTQIPIINTFLAEPSLLHQVTRIVGCNLMQRLLSHMGGTDSAPQNQATRKFLMFGQNKVLVS